MSILKIPLLDEVMTQLDTQGSELQDSIEALLESLGTVNETLIRVAEALESQAKA